MAMQEAIMLYTYSLTGYVCIRIKIIVLYPDGGCKGATY